MKSSLATHRGIRVIEEILKSVALLRHGLVEDLGQPGYTSEIMRLEGFEFPKRRLEGMSRVGVRFQRQEGI